MEVRAFFWYVSTTGVLLTVWHVKELPACTFTAAWSITGENKLTGASAFYATMSYQKFCSAQLKHCDVSAGHGYSTFTVSVLVQQLPKNTWYINLSKSTNPASFFHFLLDNLAISLELVHPSLSLPMGVHDCGSSNSVLFVDLCGKKCIVPCDHSHHRGSWDGDAGIKRLLYHAKHSWQLLN